MVEYIFYVNSLLLMRLGSIQIMVLKHFAEIKAELLTFIRSYFKFTIYYINLYHLL